MLGSALQKLVARAMHGGCRPANVPEPWRVHDGDLDEYIRGMCLSSDLLRDLGMVPQKERVKMYQNTRQIRPDHPESWLAKCVENWLHTTRGHRSNPYQQLGGVHGQPC